MLDSVATFLSGLIGGQQAKVDKAESNEMISPDVARMGKMFQNIDSHVAVLFLSHAKTIFKYLSLNDVLQVGATSQFGSNLFISQEQVYSIQRQNKKKLSNDYHVQFPTEASLMVLRKLLYRIVVKKDSVTKRCPTCDQIEQNQIKENESKSPDSPAAALDSLLRDKEEDMAESLEMPHIGNMHLNKGSFDEYDDFRPRHPSIELKKSHRRGHSYFSSGDFTEMAKIALSRTFSLTELEKWSMRGQTNMAPSLKSPDSSPTTPKGKGTGRKGSHFRQNSHPSRTVSPSVLAGRGDSSGDEGVGKGDSDDEDEEGEPAVDIAFLTFHNIIGGSR